jgi:hypothetical protein
MNKMKDRGVKTIWAINLLLNVVYAIIVAK